MPANDRRTAGRIKLQLAAKVRQPDTGRYLPARTINISESGLLLQLPTVRPLPAGTELEVVLAHADQPVLRQSRLRPAVVVRSHEEAMRTTVALQYQDRQQLAQAA